MSKERWPALADEHQALKQSTGCGKAPLLGSGAILGQMPAHAGDLPAQRLERDAHETILLILTTLDEDASPTTRRSASWSRPQSGSWSQLVCYALATLVRTYTRGRRRTPP